MNPNLSIEPRPGPAQPRKTESERAGHWRFPLSFLIGSIAGACIGYVVGQALFPASPVSPALLESPGLLERTARFAPVLAAAGSGQLGQLMLQIDEFQPGPQDSELMLFADWWTRFDPEAAHAWALSVDARHGLDVRWGVLRAWGRRDPHSALARSAARYFASNPKRIKEGGIWMDPGTQAALIGWDESLIPGAEEWVFELPDRKERQGLMAVLARYRVITMEPNAVWQWAENLPPTIAHDMLPRVASALAERKPEEAARLARSSLEEGRFPGLSRRIGTRWVKQDPQAAFAWLANLSDDHEREDAVVESARTWLSVDRAGFLTHMEGMADVFPAWLEPAFGLYARALARDQRAEQGLAIAARIGRSDRRNYTTTLILRQWVHYDRPAAEAWTKENGIAKDVARRAGIRTSDGSTGVGALR